MKFKIGLGLMAGAVMVSSTAMAEKWDMPMAYAATNFHSEHGVIFADKVKAYTGGKLEITSEVGAGSTFTALLPRGTA